ncbi:MAG: ATP-binding protein, partial [Candidatus Cloacimonetes bacterium]|nr:ATP-binding protein [Candidatus Cloacimonadota bacterium]
LMQLIVYAKSFLLYSERVTLISLQNIQSELEEQEMLAWQKLISVLTHEIMNSITPIASLSETLNEILKQVTEEIEGNEVSTETLDDIRNSIMTINRRSSGLIKFVESYRSLTKIPRPVIKIVTVNNIFKNICNLMGAEIRKQNIALELTIKPSGLEVAVDEQLIEQVLINLIKNAIHALEGKENKTIILSAYADNYSHPFISVADNGEGIIPEALDKIFIPFFTTRKEGNGIGLSLSREIMRAHGGTITVSSEPGKTIFTLRFL